MPGALNIPSPQRPTAAPVIPDEAELVARAQTDPAAFAPLYAGYLSPVYRYCYARLGSKEAAEDATSLVFAKVLASLPRYRPRDRAGSFRSWLFTIAHHVVADEFRGRRPVEPLESALDVIDAGPTPEERALAADEHHALRAHLSQLAPDQRQVVELRLAGLTDQEIAQVLQRSHGAVRGCQYRAMTRLRTLFGIAPSGAETTP